MSYTYAENESREMWDDVKPIRNEITLFGTCRIADISGNNLLNRVITFTHTTTEVIQLIRFLQKKVEIPYPYDRFCFRTGIRNNQHIQYHKEYTEILQYSRVCILEICSRKNYVCDVSGTKYYINQMALDKTKPQYYTQTPDEILKNCRIEYQTDEEIMDELRIIQELLSPKKLIVMSHYNARTHEDELIESRNNFIKFLEKYCNQQNILFVNPTVILSEYSQKEVIQDDLTHYTLFGKQKILDYMNKLFL